jgi:hypothetical protein
MRIKILGDIMFLYVMTCDCEFFLCVLLYCALLELRICQHVT